MQLVVNGEQHDMTTLPTPDDLEHFIVHVEQVIDPDKVLDIIIDGTPFEIEPCEYSLKHDNVLNGEGKIISVPLNDNYCMFILGIFEINFEFMSKFLNTDKEKFLQGKMGCWAVSGFEVFKK